LYVQATPLGDDLSNEIEADKITSKMDQKERNRLLSDKFGWDKTEAQKIWCFGPETSGPNLLCDKTSAV